MVSNPFKRKSTDEQIKKEEESLAKFKSKKLDIVKNILDEYKKKEPNQLKVSEMANKLKSLEQEIVSLENFLLLGKSEQKLEPWTAKKIKEEYLRSEKHTPEEEKGILNELFAGSQEAYAKREQKIWEENEQKNEVKEYLEKQKQELEKQVAEKIAQGKTSADKDGKPSADHKYREEEARKRLEKEEAREKLFAGFKRGGKLGLPVMIAALVAAAAITLVVYFTMNNWIALGVKTLPAPIGPLLNSLWWVAYAAIFLLSAAIFGTAGGSPSSIMVKGLLTAFIIGLVFGWLLNAIFVPFLEPILGPGLTCSFAWINAQQGGAIPTQCFGTQNANQAQKTGIVNLLSVSFGQANVPFPQPMQGNIYNFPITITNLSPFDIGPIVVGDSSPDGNTPGAYICSKASGYPQCLKQQSTNYLYSMTGSSCTNAINNCIIGVGGPPLVLSLQGPTTIDSTVFPPNSYVNIYANVKYPFTTSGTNDYYIVKTYVDVPKSIPSCSGGGSRSLGEACTGTGPINVIPYFSESQFSLDWLNPSAPTHPVTLTIAVSNIGDGTAILRSINITRFSNGLIPIDNNGKQCDNGNCNNCQLVGDSSTGAFSDNLVGQSNPYVTKYYSNVPLPSIGHMTTNAFVIPTQEAATFMCYYFLANSNGQLSSLMSGPTLDIKVESAVSYDYYETPSKTDVVVQPSPSK